MALGGPPGFPEDLPLNSDERIQVLRPYIERRDRVALLWEDCRRQALRFALYFPPDYLEGWHRRIKQLLHAYTAAFLIETPSQPQHGQEFMELYSSALFSVPRFEERLEAARQSSEDDKPDTCAAGLRPSHAKAKALYGWAMEHIDGADDMTYPQLFDALRNHPLCAGEGLPDNAAAFARYCRAAGIQRNTPRSAKGPTRSVRRASDL